MFRPMLLWPSSGWVQFLREGQSLLHPTEHEPTRHVHCIVIDKQDNTRYMHGSLPSAHTATDFV